MSVGLPTIKLFYLLNKFIIYLFWMLFFRFLYNMIK